MRKRLLPLIICFVLAITAFPFSTTAYAAGAAEAQFLDEIIIKFHDVSLFPGEEKQHQDEVAKVMKDGLDIVTDNVYVVRAADLSKNPTALLNRYKNSKFVDYVEPNYIALAESVPNDTNYKSLSAIMTVLNAPAGWDIVSGGGPLVAVIDTGVAPHADLPKASSGFSAVSSLAYSNDTRGHGTQVSGVVGAIGNNGAGIVGVNWDAGIMPVKVADEAGVMSVSNVAKGIMWAADNGAKVINMSLGTSTDSVTLKNAVNYAYNKGCALFAATGNDGTTSVGYPARYPNVLGVGSSLNGTSRAGSSNYGAGLDVVGIGTYTTTSASGGYVAVSGTSFASPQAAGLASLMLALKPSLTNDEIYSLIRQGARPLGGGYNDQTGYGLIDFGKTLSLVGGEAKPPVQDANAPELTLTGGVAIETASGKPFLDPGYAATDDVDGDVTANVTVTGAVDVNKAGLYKLEYKVADKAGNVAVATRSVTVTAAPAPIPEPPAPAAPHPPANDSKPTDVKSFLIEAATGERNDYDGSVGYEFTCLEDMAVSHVGRPLNGAMNNAHMVGIWEVNTKTLLASADVRPDSPLDALGFKTAQLDTTLTLKAGETYRIVSAETAGGDKWYDVGQANSLLPNAECAIVTAAYTAPGAHAAFPENTYCLGGNKGYTGVTFYYKLGSGASQDPVPPGQGYAAPPVITLNGPMDVSLFVGEEYVEAGYRAVDCHGVDLTGAVRVTSVVNVWTPGIYTIKYEVQDAGGNTARATRTITMAERTGPVAPPNAPRLTIKGSDPIVLHVDSGTPYTEQGANAFDVKDGDISGNVEIIGSVDRNRAGTYTLTYRVVNSAGLEATATRNVRILAPNEVKEPRATYNFSGQGKAGATVTHTGVIAEAAGYMDFAVTSMDKMTLQVKVVNQSTGAAVYSSTYTGVGGTQFWAEKGRYNVVVSLASFKGNASYGVRVVTPEVMEFIYEEEEVPLSNPDLVRQLIREGCTPLLIHLTVAISAGELNEYYADFVAAGWKKDDLGRFGVEEIKLMTYAVTDTDNLSRIAFKLYRDYSRWLEIYNMNKEIIGKDPNIIGPGMVLTVKEK